MLFLVPTCVLRLHSGLWVRGDTELPDLSLGYQICTEHLLSAWNWAGCGDYMNEKDTVPLLMELPGNVCNNNTPGSNIDWSVPGTV